MKIWVISMECAGIVEAGGVKDVTLSLCENYAKSGNDVTLFIPVFGSTVFDSVKNIKKDFKKTIVDLCAQQIEIAFTEAYFVDFPGRVIFVNHKAFSEKHGVYVYTEEEQKENPEFIRGMGHRDFHFLDTLLSKAPEAFASLTGEEPDVVHCQDASTALTPCFFELKKPERFNNTKFFVTIHNAGPAYHHEFYSENEALYYTELPWNWLHASLNGQRVEPFLLASLFSTLTTVSSFYAKELENPENNNITDGLSGIFSSRGIRIHGITNGIDYYHYAPEYPEISLLPYSMKPIDNLLDGKYKNREYFLKICGKDCTLPENVERYLNGLVKYGFLSNPENGKPVYFVYHGRIVWQKGIVLLCEVLKKLFAKNENIRFIVAGQGEPGIEQTIESLCTLNPGKIVYFKGYNQAMARLSVAASDFSVFPSNFEPCCLEDFISQIFGTIPVAHATGGLKKIIDGETGFLYENNIPEELEKAVLKAADFCSSDEETLHMMIYWASNYIKSVYSWEFVVQERYLKLFEKK